MYIARFGAGVAACLLVQFSGGHHVAGFGWANDALMPSVFPLDAQKSACILAAFLIAWIGVGHLLRLRGKSVGALVAGDLVCVGVAWTVSPLCAAFPPTLLFLCWLACPELLYFPRHYAASLEDDGKTRISFEMAVALVFVAACMLIMMRMAAHFAVAWNAPVLRWAFLLGLLGVAAYIARIRERHAAPPLPARVISMAYHSLEIWAWSSFGAIAWFWLVRSW
ncbi:hypothetical protein VIN30_01040 [Adlercreutzia sp. R7]|uniref:DUF998 domain-containing protein n=1 Tax=Adlercreutzia wanghongyangiae TaxID=3111451 RepID=A0ABU6IF20_9ACTN|nr:hypothetical protein [Adlercreutzia sp. R7]